MMRSASAVVLLTCLGLGCGKISEATGDQHDTASNAAGGGSTPGGSAGRIGAAGSGLGGSAGVSELSSVELSGAPIYTRVQRLTNSQWESAVTDILRFPAPRALSADFASPLLGVTAFDNNELVLFVEPRRFGEFESGAEAAAAIATGSPQALAALYAGDDPAGFVRTLGRRAFRRPLSAEEEAKYQDVFALGERLYGAGFANGAALVIRALLQSPHFLYRTELGPAGDPLSPYELAAKLSFWLLGTTPSDALLDAAAAGKLASTDQLVAVARQMLEDPRAVPVMRDFHGQLLNVATFQSLVKNDEYDAASNPQLALAANAFFDFIFTGNLGLRELLTSPQAYVNPALAPFYGVAAPAALEPRDVGPARSGYFMQVPFLMLGSSTAEPNPIQRGLKLERALLCAPQRPPPADIQLPVITPARPNQTTRQRVIELTESCGGTCHHYTDQLGFALENFDGLGRERELDRGQLIDTTGSYPLAEGLTAFADGNDLMRILASSPQAHTCYSKHVTSYALGRDLVEGDRPLLESLAEVSRSHSLKDVILALVKDPSFGTRKAGLP